MYYVVVITISVTIHNKATTSETHHHACWSTLYSDAKTLTHSVPPPLPTRTKYTHTYGTLHSALARAHVKLRRIYITYTLFGEICINSKCVGLH